MIIGLFDLNYKILPSSNLIFWSLAFFIFTQMKSLSCEFEIFIYLYSVEAAIGLYASSLGVIGLLYNWINTDKRKHLANQRLSIYTMFS